MKKELHPPISRELLIELYGCNNFNLNFGEVLKEAAIKINSKPIKYIEHRYGSKETISGVLIISESHLAIHTWPEYGYISIDIYTCGKKAKPYLALDVFKKYFKPKYILLNEVPRGLDN